MFLTIHGTAAAFISEHAPNIYWAFGLGFISHFILDFLPHENPSLKKWVKDKNEIKKYFYLALADFSLLTIVISILFAKLTFSNPLIIVAGITGSVLPDILWGIHKISKWKFLEPYHNFHTWTHDLWEPNLRPYQVVALQGSLLILFLVMIIK